MKYRKLWLTFILVVAGSFAVLGYYGYEIYREAPPIPGQVVTTDGKLIFTGQDIKDGQNVWQSMGGQEVGSIWGHGAYVAPDWSADWLHKEAVFMLDPMRKKSLIPTMKRWIMNNRPCLKPGYKKTCAPIPMTKAVEL